VVTQRVIGAEAIRENAEVGKSHSAVVVVVGVAEVAAIVSVGVVLTRIAGVSTVVDFRADAVPAISRILRTTECGCTP
jgi:hypothetical protein